MKKIFITATNTDIGKTYTTLKLIKAYQEMGLRVKAVKPIETGVAKEPLDGSKLLDALNNSNLSLEDVVPVTFAQPAAPFIASGQKEIDLQAVFSAVEKMQKECDVLLIEGAGGLYVPINREYFMIDLIKDLDVTNTLLVTHCLLGCINDTLLSKKALEDAGLPHQVIFNCKEKNSFEITSKPYFDAVNFPVYTVDEDIDKIAKLLYNL